MINLITKKNSAEDIIKKRAKIASHFASHLMRESKNIRSEVITTISPSNKFLPCPTVPAKIIKGAPEEAPDRFPDGWLSPFGVTL
jgi:hypothetical protein